ncbi:MAG: hypothetical protein ACR2KT_06755 [Methylocella sp.]|nr:MAG: hypothetical protein DLM68_09005 [Hyphomicrobiales bacterium]
MGGKFTLARPCARLGSKPISREKKFSPKLSIASIDSSRKSAKRRRCGFKLPGESEIDGVLEQVPRFFSGKLSPGGFGGMAGPNREPASIKIVWAA